MSILLVIIPVCILTLCLSGVTIWMIVRATYTNSHKLKIWAKGLFLLTFVISCIGSILILCTKLNLDKKEVCKKLGEESNVEYYYMCVSEEVFCQAVVQGLLEVTKKYCDECIGSSLYKDGDNLGVNPAFLECKKSLYSGGN